MRPVEIPVDVTPGMIIGAVGSDGTKHVSPEAQDVLDRLKAHYQGLGKPSAAHNYYRHLKSFFSWAEGQGHSIRTMPGSAVEDFLTALGQAGQKESTIYVMRTQLKSALRECNSVLGVDFAHLEYQTGGKPTHLKRADKEREKAKRAESRAEKAIATAAAIRAAHQMSGVTTPLPSDGRFDPFTPAAYPSESIPYTPAYPEASPMTTESVPATTGQAQQGVQSMPPMTVNVTVPPQNPPPSAPQGNRTTIGAPKPVAPAVSRPSVTINQHTFNGSYIRISRMADGTDPLTPPGTESHVTTIPLTQLAPHGDVAGFLQNFIIPNMRGLSPLVSQVHFVFHELNDRKQPTGRRDELVVGLPMSFAQQGAALPAPANLNGFVGQAAYAGPQPTGMDPTTQLLLKRLDEEAAEAKRKADELQQQIRTEKDSHNTFILMQQFQQMQDMKRELEDRKAAHLAALTAPAPAPMWMPPPSPVEVLPRIDSGTEMAKAFAESQAKMMEVMATAFRPQPVQQRDSMEFMLPFITAMNQQAQQQAASQQQMMMSLMTANQQSSQAMIQALMSRENPMEKVLLAQLQEVKAAAAAPKGDEVEDFAEKLQKMKMVAEMMGGGSSGGSGGGLISELLANAEQIGAGAAQIIAAAKEKAVTGAVAAPVSMPNMGGVTNALPPASTETTAPSAKPELPTPPESVVAAMDSIIEAAQAQSEEGIVNGVMGYLRAMSEAPEPFPKLAQRLLNGFADAEDEGELYTFAKSMWMLGGKPANRPFAKLVAAIIAKYYSEMHKAMFGTEKVLPSDADEVEETEEIVEEATEEVAS
jgi:hypothetical protein